MNATEKYIDILESGKISIELAKKMGIPVGVDKNDSKIKELLNEK